jgi:gamma-glutamyl phosphate reductase
MYVPRDELKKIEENKKIIKENVVGGLKPNFEEKNRIFNELIMELEQKERTIETANESDYERESIVQKMS